MAKRHEDALYIQAGASNPRGVARTLVEALDAVAAEGGNTRDDAACQLIAHQLAHLMGCGSIDINGSTVRYTNAMAECARAASPQVVESCRAQSYLVP